MPLETQYFIVVLAMFALACLVLALCAVLHLLKGNPSSSIVSASAATITTREEENEPDIAGQVLNRYAHQ